MKNSKKSLKNPAPNGTQPSVPVVAVLSTKTEGTSSDNAEVLKYSLAILRALAGEMISPDKWMLALGQANKQADEMKISQEARKKVLRAIMNERYKNPINVAFDGSGFW